MAELKTVTARRSCVSASCKPIYDGLTLSDDGRTAWVKFRPGPIRYRVCGLPVTKKVAEFVARRKFLGGYTEAAS